MPIDLVEEEHVIEPDTNSGDLSEHFSSAVTLDIGQYHNLFASSVRQLLKAPMPESLRSLLPDVGGSLFSAAEEQLQRQAPVSLATMRRRANKCLINATSSANSSSIVSVHQWNDADDLHSLIET